MAASVRLSTLVRWLLVPVAAAVAFVASLYFSLFALLFGPFPKDLAEPVAAILIGGLVPLAGALAAPRFRAAASAVVALVNTIIVIAFQLFPVPGAIAGGVAVTAFVAWNYSARRTPEATRLMKRLGWVAALSFVGLAGARYVDLPALPDEVPRELRDAAPAAAGEVDRFYQYDLGGFIDRVWLWRIDAVPNVIQSIVEGLKLKPVTLVPDQFWRMPPYYWPGEMPAEGRAFSSPGFTADDRGADGLHYFMVHDVAANRAYVWFKFNF